MQQLVEEETLEETAWQLSIANLPKIPEACEQSPMGPFPQHFPVHGQSPATLHYLINQLSKQMLGMLFRPSLNTSGVFKHPGKSTTNLKQPLPQTIVLA